MPDALWWTGFPLTLLDALVFVGAMFALLGRGGMSKVGAFAPRFAQVAR